VSTDKVYIGTGKIIAGKNGYDDRLKTSVTTEDLRKLLAWAEAHNGWAAVLWQKRKEPSKNGATHYGVMDTWEPEGQRAAQPAATAPTGTPTAETSDPLPF
jgi:hypothetical protein